MLVKFPVLLRNFIRFPSYSRRLHKYVFTMDKAYLRYLHSEEKFELAFYYDNPLIKVYRQFNFCRQLSESVSSFTSRVAANVEKVIKKKTKNQNSETVKASLDVNGKPVEENMLLKDVFTPSNSVELSVYDKKYNVIVNSPWVNSIALPNCILENCVQYPTKLELVNTDRTESKFAWFKSKDKKKWEQVGESFMYTPSQRCVDHYLKVSCLPRTGDIEGPTIEIVSSVKVQPSPGPFPFELRHKFIDSKRCKGKTFRVVSYNILANLYCDSDYTREVLFPYCPPNALAIDYRKQLLISEILGYCGDIICLQEVDRKVFEYDLKIIFETINYEGDFCGKRDPVAEGVACFYDKNRFRRIESHRFVLSDEISSNSLFSEIWEKIKTNENLSARILDRATVLQVNVLESKENDEVLVVGNTHLYFHPDADHIRLLQGGIIIKYLEHFVKSLKAKSGKRVSLILCGDFNSVPECGIYQLYTTGMVEGDHVDFMSNAEESVQGISLKQNLLLKSACGTPEYTNFTVGFAACLDYIFYEGENLEVTQMVPLPTVEQLQQHTALPSIVFPSDHIALISDLKWK